MSGRVDKINPVDRVRRKSTFKRQSKVKPAKRLKRRKKEPTLSLNCLMSVVEIVFLFMNNKIKTKENSRCRWLHL
jgi:hypothetical protein